MAAVHAMCHTPCNEICRLTRRELQPSVLPKWEAVLLQPVVRAAMEQVVRQAQAFLLLQNSRQSFRVHRKGWLQRLSA